MSPLLSRRVSPHKFVSMTCIASNVVFMACVALKVRLHGVCRLQSSFSWRVSPSKFVFMAFVQFEVCIHCVCRLQLCIHGVCRLLSSPSCHVSPSKFVFMACVALKGRFHGVCRPQRSFSWRVSPSKVVFMACVALKGRFQGVCRPQRSFSWRVSPSNSVMAVGRVKAAPSSFLLICLYLLFLLLRNQYIRTAKIHDYIECTVSLGSLREVTINVEKRQHYSGVQERE